MSPGPLASQPLPLCSHLALLGRGRDPAALPAHPFVGGAALHRRSSCGTRRLRARVCHAQVPFLTAGCVRPGRVHTWGGVEGLAVSLCPCKRAPAPNGAGSWRRFKAQARPRFHLSTSQATQNWTVFLNPRRSDRLVVSRTFEVPSRWVSGDRGLGQRSGTCSTWGTPNFGQVGHVAWTSRSSCADSDMKDMAS